MSAEEISGDFFKGPAYALVVGISKYEHGKEAGQPLGEKDFPNLNCAAMDARDFAEFLRTHGYISYNVQELFDDQARRENIIDELEKLKESCRQSGTKDPLVIVYFSGHGWADGKGRHYLIPYNAERDRLPATALSNKEVNDHLTELETTRLVVFIDACHSGAIGLEGVRGEVAQYDREGLGEGDGRYLIASCKRGQQSYELGNNGIFTGELLKLLKCETDDLKDEEMIDIVPLFYALKKRVLMTAHTIGKEQEPTTDMKEATGIILAVNERRKKERLEAEQQTTEEKHKFLEAICKLIERANFDQNTIIVMLRGYVDYGERLDGYREFYGCFDERFNRWNRGNTSRLDQSCELLLKAYKYADSSAVAPKESKAPDASGPSDALVKTAENKVLGAAGSKAPPISAAPSDQQQQKRQLSTAQRDHIMGERILTPDYYSEASTLLDLLDQPVSEADFIRTVHSLKSKRNDEVFESILEEIVERFPECWEQGEVVKPKTQTVLSSLMMDTSRPEKSTALPKPDSQTGPLDSSVAPTTAPLTRAPGYPAVKPPTDVSPAQIDQPSAKPRSGVFISYSHKDTKSLQELKTMLKPLVRNGAIDVWDDTKIEPGAIWKDEIKKALASTKVAVLLVSADFLASEFIANNEFTPLLKAAEDSGVIVYWIYVSSCMYQTTEIANYQAAHDISRSLDLMGKPERKKVLSEVCNKIANEIH